MKIKKIKFCLLGVQINISLFFIFAPLLFIVPLVSAYGFVLFPFAVTLSAGLQVALLLHELGHALVCKVLYPDICLKINLGIIMCYTEQENPFIRSFGEALVAIAGPGINLVLGLTLFLLSENIYVKGFAVVNLATALITSIPVKGTDSWRVIRAIFPLDNFDDSEDNLISHGKK